MGQIWNLINVDRREQGITERAKLGEFFFTTLGDLYQSLHIPCLPKEVDEWLSRGTFILQPKPIGALSTEVLDMIFEAILDIAKKDATDNFLTCISFAIGCKRLLSVGKRHILPVFIARHARAADCRIVCLGEYSAWGEDQAPPGMLTDAEIKELQPTQAESKHGQPTDEDLADDCSLYSFSSAKYKDYDDALRTMNNSVSDFLYNARGLWKVKPGEKKVNYDDLRVNQDINMIRTLGYVNHYRVLAYIGHHTQYPEGPNVLCNMSKGECVREAALVKFDSEWSSPTLAHALLSHICYSPDPSMAMACSEEFRERLAKGPWAGDRFRIVSEENMPGLAGGKEWKDVTSEVNRMLRHLWGHEASESEDEDRSEDGDGDEDGDEEDASEEDAEDGEEEDEEPDGEPADR